MNAIPPPKNGVKDASLEKKQNELLQKACSLLSETPKLTTSINGATLSGVKN